jgi:hypothetical protein
MQTRLFARRNSATRSGDANIAARAVNDCFSLMIGTQTPTRSGAYA